MVEAWRKVWRDAVAPVLSTRALEALRRALAEDSIELLQGATSYPAVTIASEDAPVEGACAIGYCGWRGEGLETVGEIDEFFGRMCFAIDQRLGVPAACRYFLNFFDETDRNEMRRELLGEVDLALAERGGAEPATAGKGAA